MIMSSLMLSFGGNLLILGNFKMSLFFIYCLLFIGYIKVFNFLYLFFKININCKKL